MKRISLLFLAMLPALLLLSSCSDFRQTRNLYDDWWPVHASGSFDNDRFTANWDGDLDIHGDIVIKYVSKQNSSLYYEDTKYYPAYRFTKKGKTFSTISIESLSQPYNILKNLKFEVKDGVIYFEKPNERGKGTGEFDEGQPLKFIDDNTVQIGNVKYQRFKYFKESHPEVFKPLSEKGFDLEWIPVIDKD